MSQSSGTILHLQRLSTEDGPGIRTTVFFKGCPLRCGWCHNPESLSREPQIQWLETRCIQCNTCLESCPMECLKREEDGRLIIERKVCNGCGLCVTACPANALDMLGTQVKMDALVAEVLKDRNFYDTSGGGVTVSGGEPGMQAEFVAEFLNEVKQAGVSTALDTCGLVSRAGLEKMLPFVDLVLYDLKEIDSRKHQSFTAQGNEQILENLVFLREYMRIHPEMHLWVRTPIIPGATASQENLRGIGKFLADSLNGQVDRWELCAFNNLCRDKYHRLGMDWGYGETPLLSAEEMNAYLSCAKDSGVDPKIIFSTGATKIPA